MTKAKRKTRANACQAAYLEWAKANPQNALAGIDRRNRWLERNGRKRHQVTRQSIDAL